MSNNNVGSSSCLNDELDGPEIDMEEYFNSLKNESSEPVKVSQPGKTIVPKYVQKQKAKTLFKEPKREHCILEDMFD